MTEVATVVVEHDPFAGPALARTAPVTASQQELWTAVQMGVEASCAFNESNSLHLRGRLDVDALRIALQDLVERHEALRATLSRDGRTLLIATSSTLDMPLHDLSALSVDPRGAEAGRLLEAEVEEPFDLERGPLVRARLIRLAPEEHLLVITAHHIVCDGWSTGVMVRDLASLYSARSRSALPALDQPAAFSVYARERVQAEAASDHAEHERWWLERFSGEIPTLDLPLDHARPPFKTYNSAREDLTLDGDLVDRLKRFAAGRGASFFTVLLAGFETLLFRLCAQTDLVVGILSAGQATSGQPRLVGHCVNTLPIRSTVDGASSFTALVGRLRSDLLDASEHAEYTYGTLLSKLPLPRDGSRLPLVSVLFNLDQEISADDLPFDGLVATFASTPRRYEMFDLFLNAVEADGRLRLECQYNIDLLDAATVRRWLETLERLIGAASADPECEIRRLPILSAAEQAHLRACNDTRLDYPRNAQVHSLVEAQVERDPDAIAVVFEDEDLTYVELDRRANRLARRLRDLGVTRNELVGLCLERSPEMLVALLAVSKAGGAYVPLDPEYPHDRLELMIRDSGMRLVLTEEELRDRIPDSQARVFSLDAERAAIAAQRDTAPPAVEGASPEDAVYAIYTSGSTGTPKGVLVPHRAVVNLLTSARSRPGMTERDVVVAIATLAFDIAVCELWLPLSVGARIVMAPRKVAADGERLLALMQAHAATYVQATPTTWRLLIAAGWNRGNGLKALSTGEALPADLADELVVRTAEAWNMYGPTETTVWSSRHRLGAPGEPVLIGEPFANTQLHILDDWLEPVPVGVRGELYIGGHGVTLGYVGRPELTAERFVADPFRDEPGARMYRTGDVARRRADGLVEYLGRNDHQVKVRGYRIELGEIENVLTRHPSVAQAVAVAREHRTGDVRLVAYVVPVAGSAWSADAMRLHLQRVLPEYMVPSQLVEVEELPLTPSGKIDRRALPDPPADSVMALDYVAPRSEAERVLADIWQDVLGIGRIGIHDDFFQLGGHSLLAAQVVSRLARDRGIAMPLRQMFEDPTIARLAPRLAEQRRAVPIPRRAGEALAPATAMQRRIWLLDRLGFGRSFNLPGAWRLRGRLDLEALQQSVDAFIARHEATRTTLRSEGDELLLAVAPTLKVDLTPIDLSGIAAVRREEELMKRLLAASEVPFDLIHGPLFRVSLFRLEEDEHVLLLVPHNAVWDGWCFDIFHHELDLSYRALSRGLPSPVAEPAVQYSDFAAWHREWLQGPDVAGQVDYWHRQLAGGLTPLRLPADRPRPRIVGEDGATEWMTIPLADTDRLSALGLEAGATLYMVLLAAFATLLHRSTGQDDFLVGSAVRGRPQPEVEEVVGLFMKDIVLRMRFEPQLGFLDLVRQVRATVLDAFSHQDPPLESLGAGHVAEYRAALYFQDARSRPTAIGDLALQQLHVLPPAAATDLRIWMIRGPGGIVGGLNYTTELFDAATVRQLLAGFRTLLRSILEDPTRPVDHLALVPDGERPAIASGAGVPRTAELLHAPFEAEALRRPSAVAVATRTRSASYGELLESSAAVAMRLWALGVGPSQRVGICTSAGVVRAVALLGVARAGGVAVPMDPTEPGAWLRRIVDDSTPTAVLVDGDGRAALGGDVGAVVINLEDALRADDAVVSGPAASPDDLALIAYTAGPHGRPLGVELTHRALSATVAAVGEMVGLGAHDRLLATGPLSSGRSTLEVWLALGTGAALISEPVADARRLCGLIESWRITAIHADPTVWELLIAAGWTGGADVLALVSGGAVPSRLAAAIEARTGRAYSLYGMAETGFWSGAARIGGEGDRPTGLGRPLGDARWYAVDRELQAVLPGLPGELLIAGSQVARGYHGSPPVARTRFPDDPHANGDGAGWVRTGDRVRVCGDGRIELIGGPPGRLVVEGRRIEACEVERLLEAHPSIREAAVAVDVRWDEPELVAHIAYRPGAVCTGSELRHHLAGALPGYMVPRRFEEVGALPRRADGSVDRSRLQSSDGVVGAGFEAPRSASEHLLAGLWCEVLGVTEVSVHDNFFDLGGHSLLCLQVIAELERRVGTRFDPRLLLLNTLEQAAAELDRGTSSE